MSMVKGFHKNSILRESNLFWHMKDFPLLTQSQIQFFPKLEIAVNNYVIFRDFFCNLFLWKHVGYYWGEYSLFVICTVLSHIPSHHIGYIMTVLQYKTMCIILLATLTKIIVFLSLVFDYLHIILFMDQ